ncbi:hypothetical protein PGTUg99_008536 [Puccinia graminis f. sp. tritici]|uniref:Uncharacterized protein n=1 Tax=Puccinia graminis f. sp. tritici TaxID=56615 RepID=A0A5B0Q3K5_PUCGR|nr:hypothetical protein PGTUg99_008536 [Puccinia graminis f. sp. tritici]
MLKSYILNSGIWTDQNRPEHAHQVHSHGFSSLAFELGRRDTTNLHKDFIWVKEPVCMRMNNLTIGYNLDTYFSPISRNSISARLIYLSH